jgi:hypothetical protein
MGSSAILACKGLVIFPRIGMRTGARNRPANSGATECVHAAIKARRSVHGARASHWVDAKCNRNRTQMARAVSASMLPHDRFAADLSATACG